MTALTGTEKQITWAETIRAEKLAEIPALDAKLAAMKAANTPDDAADPAKVEATLSLIAQATERYRNQTSAAYWIDNRGNSAEYAIKQIAKSLR